MGYDTYLDGEVWAAADAQLALNQSVIVCTSSTRPSSPVEGMHIYQTDDNRRLVYDGAAWTTISPVWAAVATSETYTAGTYGDPSTPGPAITVQTGTSGLVVLTAFMRHSLDTGLVNMGYAATGATTLAADDTRALRTTVAAATANDRASAFVGYSSYTAGVNVLTSKYKTSSATATVADRLIIWMGTP